MNEPPRAARTLMPQTERHPFLQNKASGYCSDEQSAAPVFSL
jgi:hypothetical protein